MRRLCAASIVFMLVASCRAQVNSPFTTYRHVADHNMSTMSAVHCSSVVLVGASSKIVFGDGTVQTTAAGGGANAMQNPSTGTLNMSGYGIERLAFLQAATTYGGMTLSFSNSPSGIFADARLMPDADITRDIGSPSYQWRNIYASSLCAGGVSIDALVYPRNADYPIFSMSGSDFRIGQPFLSGHLYIGSNTNGVKIVGPFSAGSYGEPISFGTVYPNSDNARSLGSTSLKWHAVYTSTCNAVWYALNDVYNVKQFIVHYTTFDSVANYGLLISTGGVLAENVRGLFIDRGVDNPDYAGNVIIGELSANSFTRSTQGRLNVKGAFYVTSGYSNEYVRISNSSSGNHIEAGNVGIILECEDTEVFRGNVDGTIYLSTSITGSGSYSLLRINTSNGRVYYDTSSKRNKRNIRPWIPSTGTLHALAVRRFTETTTGRESFGLIAEELDAAGVKDLVVYDDRGKIVGVAYEKVALVLIPVLHEQQARIERLERAVAALSSGTFAAEFPDGFPVGKPTTEQGGNALNLLAVLAALLMGGVGVYVGRKVK